jgi:hypothetical protein
MGHVNRGTGEPIWQNEKSREVRPKATREKVLKLRFSLPELRRVRLAAVLMDQSPAQFMRNSLLEKADPECLKRLQEDG